MKKYIILMLSSLALLFTACEDDVTENISKDYDLKLVGGQELIWQLNGDKYADPGFVATYGGTDAAKMVTVKGTVDIHTVGLYPITYTFTPKTGVKVVRTRNVIVADKSVTLDMSGTYVTSGSTHRIRKGAETAFVGQEVVITKVAPGFFKISDFMGGFYESYYGYGSAYTSGGYVQLESNGNISLLSSTLTPWGIGVDKIENAKYNSSNSSIYWESSFAGMTFYVELTKKEE